jgi:hypothetical protein
MALTVNLRKMLHRKSAEYCTPNAAGSTVSGSFIVSYKSDAIPNHDTAYYVGGVSTIWNYSADQDAWQQMPNSGAAGAFAAGACGEFHLLAAPGGNTTNTATGGTTTSFTTNLTITRDLAGHEVRIVGGAGAGYTGKILGNTLGANAVITLATASNTAFSNTTQYQIFSGSLWFFNAGTTAVGFSVYDRATSTWTARSVSGVPTAWGTDGQLIGTPSRTSNNGNGFVNGTATAGGSNTITLEASKTMLSNQWANYQIRVISGTGAGQVRTISSNTSGTSSVITVSANWATVPDSTSVYRIEGNDDYLYLLGNNVVTMYRYSISGNAWTTLSPATARAGAPGGGLTANWIDDVQVADWQDGSYATHYTGMVSQNGRYIYSLRGAGSNALDVYDISANTWINNVLYGQQMETFTAGSCAVDLYGYIHIQKDSTGRIYRFDVAKNVLEPWVFNPVPQGAAVTGDKMFVAAYRDGASEVDYLYTLGNTRSELTRWVMI